MALMKLVMVKKKLQNETHTQRDAQPRRTFES